ncbi:MAG TPA: hypothetical protein VFK09_13790, partial [Gemmatimonadales bacterium]|nr:hypothetical protein [Gemmatimonadales bacterium]
LFLELRMSLLSPVLLASLLAMPAAQRGPEPPPPLKVIVDSAKHEVTVVSGPWKLPNMPPMEDHGMMDMAANSPVQRFEWPIEGWFRGFRYELVDQNGKVLDRRVLHHMIMVNFDRRQLLYPAVERLAGAGSETADAVVPKTIGVPLTPGTHLGMYIMWHNETGKDLDAVYLRYSMIWAPKNQNPQPVNSLPIYMDVNLTVGGSNTFDVPPGRFSKSYEFTLPVGGRLLGVGGHLHDYGVDVKLIDAESGKELTRVVAKRDSAGRVLGVSRKLFGVTGEGLKLKAGHRYRVVGEYDNPTGKTIPQGAMAHMVGLFVPDDMSKWPAVDPRDPTLQKDLASLQQPAAGGMQHGHGSTKAAEMDHGNMDHGSMDHEHMDHGTSDPPRR